MKKKLYISDIKNSIKFNNDIENILKWNKNKDIILWAYEGNIYKRHSKILYPFSIQHINPNIAYSSILIEDNNEFSKLFDINTDRNVFIAIQYLANIEDEFIIIKDAWINDYYSSTKNKRVIVFEAHCNVIDSRIIFEWFTELYKIMEKK
jgi:predicted phosphatase